MGLHCPRAVPRAYVAAAATAGVCTVVYKYQTNQWLHGAALAARQMWCIRSPHLPAPRAWLGIASPFVNCSPGVLMGLTDVSKGGWYFCWGAPPAALVGSRQGLRVIDSLKQLTT